MKRNIIIVSGTRADYGLLRKVTQLFQNDSEFETYMAVTGSHLSEKHGLTINYIKQDLIKNIQEVDMKISGDAPENINASISYGIKGFSDLYSKIKPEFIIVLGDRYELWAACLPATVANIPIVHLHGGESTQGVIDEAVRHSITKMAHLHLCSHESYKKRIIRMGEAPDRVHVVGAVGLDRIKEMKFLTRSELEKNLGITFGKKNILCTFHPVTINSNESDTEVLALTDAIEEFIKESDTKVFITFPNADTYSSNIQDKWDALIKRHPKKISGFVNLGDQRYISLMKEVDLVLGNSSSGILEAPFLNKAVVNVGIRQQGRLTSEHIIHSTGIKTEILNAITKAMSDSFQINLSKVTSIYGEGNSSSKIHEIIKKTKFQNINLKIFYDGLAE